MAPCWNPSHFHCVGFAACVQEEENRLREELRQEWELKQEKIKSECHNDLRAHKNTRPLLLLEVSRVSASH